MCCTPTLRWLIVLTLPPRYRCPLNWLPASRLLLPRSGLEPSDFVLCAGFWTPATMKDPRGQLAGVQKAPRHEVAGSWHRPSSECYVDLMLAPSSMMGRTPARGHLQGWSHGRSGECGRHFDGCSERVNA